MSEETNLMPYYNMIADETELHWFFDHIIQKPALYESYTAVWVSRHKKLTKEERETLGMTRRESEFLRVETMRPSKIKSTNEESKFTFNKFLQHIKRFNVHKEAYTTDLGLPLPEKTLAVIFYVNPCSEIKVADRVMEKLESLKSMILTGVTNGKDWSDLGQLYQSFGNLDNDIKHFRAQCKGASYYMDFDLDVPDWFRYTLCTFNSGPDNINQRPYVHLAEGYTKYYKAVKERLDARFGKGNYAIISTSGGYHILVKACAIKSNPHDFCKEVELIYKRGIYSDGNMPYLSEEDLVTYQKYLGMEKNASTAMEAAEIYKLKQALVDKNSKFECIVNDSQIPGLPLPGTYQYGRPVFVINKEDFED